MGQGVKRHVKVVGDAAFLEPRGFRETGPETVEVCDESVFEVLKGCSTDVISDDKEQKGLLF